jgi:membrane protease YdiL (CAAX protease family)
VGWPRGGSAPGRTGALDHHGEQRLSATRRALPTDLADAARSAVPIGLLILAAAVPPARPFVLAALVAGTAVAIRRDAPVRWSWAAPIPVAVSLVWGMIPAPLADPGGADCTDPASPPAVWRAVEALLALGALAVLAIVLRARPSDLGWRWPRRAVVQLAVAGAVVLGPFGLLAGAFLARPFFGAFELDLSRPGFLVPALVFAFANGLMEELSYRGALMGWTAKVTGTWLALVGQAVAFGVAHAAGGDVGGSPVALGVVLGVGGFIAGWLTLRTRSLLIPIAWHVALDLPLYAYFACRAP